jgi:hypothetical protein
MSVTNQYLCEYAQLDRRSVPAQLRGNGDGRNELYDLFLRMEGMGNGLVEKNGDVFDAYAAAMSGTKLTPASAWLLVRLGRAMNRLESISERLAKVAAKYDRDPPDSNGSRGRRIQPTFLSGNLL